MSGYFLNIEGETFEFCHPCFTEMRRDDNLEVLLLDEDVTVDDASPYDNIDCARCGEVIPGRDRTPDDGGEPPMCSHCSGTGMPMFGPPDVGHCSSCGGSGIDRSYDDGRDDYDDDPRYDEWEEEQAIRRAEAAYERRIYGP